MLRKPFCLLLIVLIFALTACGSRGTDSGAAAASPPASTAVEPTASPSASALVSSPSASAEASEAKADNSARAIGEHAEGRLLIRPASQATVAALGAPSCYGQETDLRWTGDYEAVWVSKSDEKTNVVMTFPAEFEIVQPTEAPVQLQQFTLSGTDIIAYVPRYEDCHDLETYFFGISDGHAYPLKLEMKPDVSWTTIGQLPHHEFKVRQGELIVTGGYAAGMDFIDIYHFQYDKEKKALILKQTEQVSPNEIDNNT